MLTRAGRKVFAKLRRVPPLVRHLPRAKSGAKVQAKECERLKSLLGKVPGILNILFCYY